MTRSTGKQTLSWVLFTEAVGGLAALLTRESVKIYSSVIEKPPLSPPAIVFPIVWVLLYALMGLGAARIARTLRAEPRTAALRLYLLQLTVNFLWSILFFNFRSFGFAFVWLVLLWALVVRMILSFRELDRTAALLQLPYLLWLVFAGYLNFGVWMLNR